MPTLFVILFLVYAVLNTAPVYPQEQYRVGYKQFEQSHITPDQWFVYKTLGNYITTMPIGFDISPFIEHSKPIKSTPNLFASYVSLENDNGAYLNKIKAKVKSNWAPPAVLCFAIVSLTINNDGIIENATTLLSSGNIEYDKAALDSIAKTHCFVCPPRDTHAPVKITITFSCDPRLNEHGWDPFLPHQYRYSLSPIYR